jgi:hypothetical protein
MNYSHRLGYVHPDAFCLMTYQSTTTIAREVIWNARDGVTPFTITMLDGSEGVHVDWNRDVFDPIYTPPVGSRAFVNLSPAAALVYRVKYVDRYWNEPVADGPTMRETYDGLTAAQAAAELAAADVRAFGFGTTPDLVVVDEWFLNDLKSRRVRPTRLW